MANSLPPREAEATGGDDAALDFAGAGGDGAADGAKGAGRLVDDLVLRAITKLAVGAEEVHAGEGDALAHLAAEQLRGRGFVVRDHTLGLHGGDAVGEER